MTQKSELNNLLNSSSIIKPNITKFEFPKYEGQEYNFLDFSAMPIHVPDLSNVADMPLMDIDTSIHHHMLIKRYSLYPSSHSKLPNKLNSEPTFRE